jgi:hypothetical protein
MDAIDDLLTPQALVVAKDAEDVKELLAALDSWGFKTFWAKDGEAGYNVLDGSEVIHALIRPTSNSPRRPCARGCTISK